MTIKRYQVAGYQIFPERIGLIEGAAVLGYSDSLEGAEQLRANGLLVGWKIVRVVDTHTQQWIEPQTTKSRKPREDSQAAARVVRKATERD